jgi:hypothetical protein
MLSGCGSGAGVMPCADDATNKAKPATAINLSIVVLPGLSNQSDIAPCIPSVRLALEIDQGDFGAAAAVTPAQADAASVDS